MMNPLPEQAYWNRADLGDFVVKQGFTVADMRDGDSTNPDKIYVIARPQ